MPYTMTKTQTKASTSKPKPLPAPPPKTTLKAQADPNSEDDFEIESKQEARDYKAIQENEAERQRTKEENKKRKKEGLEPLKLPAAVAKKRSRNELGQGARQSFPQGSDSDSSSSLTNVRKKSKRGRGDDDLTYEGQVILGYNALHRLAGIEETEGSRSTASKTPRQSFSPSRQNVVSAEDPSVKDSVQGTGPAVATADPTASRTTAENEDEEDGYSSEEFVVPWSATRAQVAPVAPIVEPTPPDDGDGYYSDELTLEKDEAPQGSRLSQTEENGPDDESVKEKPAFGATYTPAADVPLHLDPLDPDIKVPSPLNRYLKEYQRDGVKFFYNKYAQGRGGVLGDDMGLGKTIQVIAFVSIILTKGVKRNEEADQVQLSAVMRKTGTYMDTERRKQTIRNNGCDLSPRHWPTALIICPKFLLRNWQRELATWGFFEVAEWQSDTCRETKKSFGRGYFDIILTSYESARANIEELKDMPFSIVIADEAHRMKEAKAATTLALKKIQCASCFALTGTLIQNRMDEMWSVLDFVDRGHAGTLKQWRDFAVNPIKKGHRLEGTTYEVVTGILRLGTMVHKILPHFYLRRDKRLIASELPEKRDMVVFCPLGERQIAAYQNLIDSPDVQFIVRRDEPCECQSGEKRLSCHHKLTEEGETLQDVILKNINALSKVANHFGLLYPAHDDKASTIEVNRRIFKTCTGVDYVDKQQNAVAVALDPGNCGKWQLLAELLKGWRAEGKQNKILVFSNSVRLLKMIAEFIPCTREPSVQAGADDVVSDFNFKMLTGEVGIDQRMEMVDLFQDPNEDWPLLLISTMAGGVGLNLTAANKVVIFDPAWNPASDLQAMDRAFRIGQKRTVDVYRLIGQGTLEELMYERQIHKQQRSRQLNEGTFESRMHQGFDGAKTKEDQGELFGTQNIFRFDPKGFVQGNLERVRQAEDRFAQDLIEAEYNEDEDLPQDELDDEEGRRMRNERRDRDIRKEQAAERKRRNDEDVIQTVLGGVKPEPRQEDDILTKLGITSQFHESAFRDSPNERDMYEIGIQLLKTNPELSKKMKANDLGKLGRPASSRKKDERKEKKQVRRDVESDDESWIAARIDRIAEKKTSGPKAALAELSD